MLTDKSVRDLLDAFSSNDPTPGGGSAAALAGALGASLLIMVAAMPKTKSGAPEERVALDAAKPGLEALRSQLIDLIDRDSAAYELVMAAFKRPKATDEDKAARRAAIQDATRVATEVPLETMRACAAVIKTAAVIAANGNPNAASDAAVGVHMARAGLLSAQQNVEINLSGLADVTLVARLRDEAQALARDTA